MQRDFTKLSCSFFYVVVCKLLERNKHALNCIKFNKIYPKIVCGWGFAEKCWLVTLLTHVQCARGASKRKQLLGFDTVLLRAGMLRRHETL